MGEILWWKKESWYESKSIPIFGFFVSPRQLIFVLSSGFLGFLAQFAVQQYYAKIALMVALVASGGVLSSFQSNVVPWELAVLASLFWHEKRAKRVDAPKVVEPRVQELSAGVPLAVVGELAAEKPEDVILYVDGVEVATAKVTAENPKYRLYYMPNEDQKGAHELEVVSGGRTIKKLEVEVR